MQGTLRLRLREIIAQVSEEMGIKIINGVLSADYVHIFAEIPPHVSVSEFVKVAKGRSSRKIQIEFPKIHKQYWGRHFWAKGFFSSTSGNITDEMMICQQFSGQLFMHIFVIPHILPAIGSH